MANIQINQLPAATLPLSGTELLPADQGAATVQIAVTDIVSLVNSNAVLNTLGTPQVISDILANRPGSTMIGTIFVSTDSPYTIYQYNGAAWNTLAGTLQSISSSTLDVDLAAPQAPVINLPYTRYLATVSQSGASDPTLNVLENTTPFVFTFTRGSQGFYGSNTITQDITKIAVRCTPGGTCPVGICIFVDIVTSGPTLSLTLASFANYVSGPISSYGAYDGLLINALLEILIYP